MMHLAYPNISKYFPELMLFEDFTPDSLLVAVEPFDGNMLLFFSEPAGRDGGVCHEAEHEYLVGSSQQSGDKKDCFLRRETVVAFLEAV